MGIENLNGNIVDHNGNPISNAKVSVYRKIGEAFSDENGNYVDVRINDTNDYLVSCSKNEYYDNITIYSSDTTNLTLMKNDDLIEPPLPENIQVIDNLDGNSISINWSTINFDFIAGYNIYKSDEIQGIFERINNELIVENSYIDSQIETFKKYYYMVEVVSANNPIANGITSMSQIIGPIEIIPVNEDLIDISNTVKKIKVDSTKTNKTSDKVFNNGGGTDTWWESQKGAGSWIEIVLNKRKNINGFYFKRPFIGIGILFGTLQYWNYESNDWSNIQKLNFFIEREYTFKDFMINTDRVRLYVNETESLSETQISDIVIYGG
jgi:hypothetical protein